MTPLAQVLLDGWLDVLRSGAPQFFGAAMLFLVPLGVAVRHERRRLLRRHPSNVVSLDQRRRERLARSNAISGGRNAR